MWRQVTPFGSDYELLDGERIVGEMSRPADGGVGAWGECFGEEWRVGAVLGFTGRTRVRLVRVRDRALGWGYEGRGWRRGAFLDPEGGRLRWTRRGFFSRLGENHLFAGAGTLLLEAWTAYRKMVFLDVHVRPTAEGRGRPELGQHLVLVLFLLAQHEATFRRPYRLPHGNDPLRRIRGPDFLEPPSSSAGDLPSTSTDSEP